METPREQLRSLVVRLRDFNRAQLKPVEGCEFVRDAQRETADCRAYATATAVLSQLAAKALDLLSEEDRTRLLLDMHEDEKVIQSLKVSA